MAGPIRAVLAGFKGIAGSMGSLSIWHWLLVLLVMAIPAVLGSEAYRRVRAEGGVMAPGFTGWLFVLAAWVWLTPLRGVFEMARMLTDAAGVGQHFPWLVRVDLLITAISVALAGLCLVLMLRRAEAFRMVFPLVAAWVVLSFPVSVLCARFVLGAVYAVPIGLAELFAAVSGDLPQWGGGLIAAVAWVAYVRRSRRVAMTFTH